MTILENYLIENNHSISKVDIGINRIGESKIDKIKRVFKKYLKVKKSLKENDEKSVFIFFVSGLGSYLEKIMYLYLFDFKKNNIFFFLRAGAFFESVSTNFFYKFLVKSSTKNEIKLLVQGETFYNKISFLKNKIYVLPNWTLTDNFNLQKKLSIKSKHNIYISFIGWFNINKGTIELIEFIKKTKNMGLNFRFRLFGDGPLLNFIKNENKINNLNIEIISGLDFPQIKKIISNDDYFILPSKTEGLPNSLFETMGTGLIPIVTNVGCISDYIKDFDNGIFFNKNLNITINNILKIEENYNLKKRIRANIHKFNEKYNYLKVLQNLLLILNNEK